MPLFNWTQVVIVSAKDEKEAKEKVLDKVSEAIVKPEGIIPYGKLEKVS